MSFSFEAMAGVRGIVCDRYAILQCPSYYHLLYHIFLRVFATYVSG